MHAVHLASAAVAWITVRRKRSAIERNRTPHDSWTDLDPIVMFGKSKLAGRCSLCAGVLGWLWAKTEGEVGMLWFPLVFSIAQEMWHIWSQADTHTHTLNKRRRETTGRRPPAVSVQIAVQIDRTKPKYCLNEDGAQGPSSIPLDLDYTHQSLSHCVKTE